MSKLTREEVEHIAKLARISLSEAEIATYQETLATLMDEIKQVETIEANEMLVSPSSNKNMFYDNAPVFNLNGDLLVNAPHKKGTYIEVERVLND